MKLSILLTYVVFLVIDLKITMGFLAPNSKYSMKSLLYSDLNGSPLPPLDPLTPPKARSPEIQSPLVDRALDSALDFLQDGDSLDTENDSDDDLDLFDIYEDSPDIEIPYELIAELESKEADAIANKGVSSAQLNEATIKAAIKKWQKSENDCGSAEVQVAIANERIKYLTKHLLSNRKDVSARRGLQTLVTLRRRFLNYLYEHDREKAEKMITELGIRFRPPGRLWDKEAKYGAFKNTKSKWEKIRFVARQERDQKKAKVSA